MFIYVSIYIYVYMYIYVYIYIYIHTHILVLIVIIVIIITRLPRPRRATTARSATSWARRTSSSRSFPPSSGRKRFASIRFGSVSFEKSLFRFGSVWQLFLSGSMRFGLYFLNASWFGPVRFGSVPRPVPAGSEIKRFGSVRPIGSVSYSFLRLPGHRRALPVLGPDERTWTPEL